jgi:hypothetical protein
MTECRASEAAESLMDNVPHLVLDWHAVCDHDRCQLGAAPGMCPIMVQCNDKQHAGTVCWRGLRRWCVSSASCLPARVWQGGLVAHSTVNDGCMAPAGGVHGVTPGS